MALSGNTRNILATALASPPAANEIATALNASVASPAAVIAAIGASTIAAIGATTNLTAVPGSFADAAAVQAYLAGVAAWPLIESRLDAIEAKTDVLVSNVNALNLKVDALIAALKAAGLMASS